VGLGGAQLTTLSLISSAGVEGGHYLTGFYLLKMLTCKKSERVYTFKGLNTCGWGYSDLIKAHLSSLMLKFRLWFID